jgi:hypothetical protein
MPPAPPIRALKIDAKARTITEIELPTKPGKREEGYVSQVELKDLSAQLGCEDIEVYPIDRNNQIVLDGEAMFTGEPPTHFWQWGEDCAPIADGGLITGYNHRTDAWKDTTITLDQAKAMVKFTLRKAGGTEIEGAENGPGN